MTPVLQRVLGIDVSRKRLDLAWSDGACGGEAFTPPPVAYDDDGLCRLLQLLREQPPSLVVLESTGGLENDLVDALLDAELPVARVEPGRVRHFAKADAVLAKTDQIDARVLANFGQRMKVRLLEKREKNRDELDALVTCRRQLLLVKTRGGFAFTSNPTAAAWCDPSRRSKPSTRCSRRLRSRSKGWTARSAS